MSDMQAVIIPKSDQLNADDLIAGPMTVKITNVTIRGGTEQPISISFDGDNGKPYKACKSMCRVMVTAWGPDSKRYVGRSMTLYRDPSVKWAGMEVGGIRISHMSDIDAPMTMALTMTKQNRKPFTVKPLEVVAKQDYASDISKAATLDDLATVWKAIPASEKTALTAVKDARKAELTKPATDDFVAEYESASQGRQI